MPNYNESTVSGTTWQRCHTVTVSNPLAQTPKIAFQEEKVVMLAGETVHQWCNGCEKVFEAATTFPVLDPATNLPTGQSVSHGELYVLFYSLYMQTALERDAQPPG